LALVLIALNLRPALSSLAPLLEPIRQTLQLGAATAGLLTTLPVLCLGLFAPLAPPLAQRFGTRQAVYWSLWLLALGLVARSLFGVFGLFLGSLLAGAAIGIINVLLPGLLKREFPNHAGSLTGIYTMALCLGAALAAGLTVPAARLLSDDWRLGLGIWTLPVFLALLCWRPYLRAGAGLKAATTPGQHGHTLWRDRLAWQITLYMGLQSSLAYIVYGWLPAILAGRGLSPLDAGLMLGGSVLIQLPSALFAPWLATRGRDQRLAISLTMALVLTGFLGCLYAPRDQLWLYASVLGLGQGASFSLALSLLVLRSADALTAAQLSSMSQSIGYLLAALGPLLVGLIYEWTGDWQNLAWLFIAISLGALIFGLSAGRDRLVLEGKTQFLAD
jgi:CP family cyanate transporter-like MFS transporter